MKTLISITRILAIAVAMFSFASGAWAEHDGDGVAHDADEVTDTEVVGEEDLLDTEIIGDEEVVDDSEVIGDEEVVDDSEVIGDEEVVDDSEVIGDEEVVDDSEVIGGDEVIFYTMGDEESLENTADSDGTGEETGYQDPTNIYDSEGNLVGAYRSQEGGVEEVDMTVLMSQSGAAGGASITLADTAANQAGVDSATGISLDVVEQAESAVPLEVATVAADGSTSAGNGGTATRISGGHLDSQK